MTESLDLDALEAVARAATPGPWVLWDDGDVGTAYPVTKRRRTGLIDGPYVEVVVESDHVANTDAIDGAFIAAFDPPTALALIGRVREAEREMHSRELHHFEEEQMRAAAEAEVVEAHAHFAVQEGRLREALARAEKAEADRDVAIADADATFAGSDHLSAKYYQRMRNAERLNPWIEKNTTAQALVNQALVGVDLTHVGTHSPDCHTRHIACLALAVKTALEGGQE